MSNAKTRFQSYSDQLSPVSLWNNYSDQAIIGIRIDSENVGLLSNKVIILIVTNISF